MFIFCFWFNSTKQGLWISIPYCFQAVTKKVKSNSKPAQQQVGSDYRNGIEFRIQSLTEYNNNYINNNNKQNNGCAINDFLGSSGTEVDHDASNPLGNSKR